MKFITIKNYDQTNFDFYTACSQYPKFLKEESFSEKYRKKNAFISPKLQSHPSNIWKGILPISKFENVSIILSSSYNFIHTDHIIETNVFIACYGFECDTTLLLSSLL